MRAQSRHVLIDRDASRATKIAIAFLNTGCPANVARPGDVGTKPRPTCVRLRAGSKRFQAMADAIFNALKVTKPRNAGC